LKKNKLPTISQESSYIEEFIKQILEQCPERQATSLDEYRASMMVRDEFAKLGLSTRVEEFLFNDNLYANIALHFGAGSLGTLISGVAPLAAFFLHTLCGISYWADSNRKAYILRRIFPFKKSQNVIATLPAKNKPRLRIVVCAHVDAAFTGLMFNPKVIKALMGVELPVISKIMERPLRFAVQSQFALAASDLLRCLTGPLSWPLRPLEMLVSIPTFLAFAMTLETVLSKRLVPGANDDLSAVAGLLVLASRFLKRKHPEVELVFVATGAEEAGMGGSDALARAKKKVWDRESTVIVGLECLGNGDLNYLDIEGEVTPMPVPTRLAQLVNKIVQKDKRFAEVRGFTPQVGGSDIVAFLAHGFEGLCLCCIDRELNVPRHYHQPTDSLQNLEIDKVLFSIDFAEKLMDEVIAAYLPKD